MIPAPAKAAAAFSAGITDPGYNSRPALHFSP